MALIKVKDITEFENEAEKYNGLSVVHFSSSWAPQCEQMNEVLLELSKQQDLKDVKFVQVEAEDLAEISLKYKINAVPTFILLNNGKSVDRLDGADAAALTSKINTQASRSSLISGAPAPPKEDLNTRLKRLINSSKCMLFMKGTPENPQCGFSRTTIELLNNLNANYGSFNILSDDEVRQGLKTYSNWQTYPQLYIDGELIGGLDILKEMNEGGELEPMLPKKINLNDRLKSLINKAPLMLFMKGEPSNPRCKFSKQLMEIMTTIDLPYGSFNILEDEEVRQGLKTYSNWQTYPQIYVKGQLVGGIDILKEMQADGSLLSTLKGE